MEVYTPPNPWSVLMGWLIEGAFTFGRWATGVGIGILSWVYDSPLEKWIKDQLEPAAKVSRDIRSHILEPLNLIGFFLLLALLYAGWHTIRGRAAHGVGEFGLSLVIYMVMLMAVSDPVNGFLNAFNGVTDIAGQVMSAPLANGFTTDGYAGGNRCPQQTDSRHRALVVNAASRGELPPSFQTVKCVLRVELVDVPYDLFNWGRVIKPGDPCWDNRQRILRQGIGANGDEDVIPILRANGCTLRLNANPNWDRFFAVLLYVLTALVFTGLLVIFAGMMLIALLTVVFLLIWIWPAFALGLVPRGGRHYFWRYITSIVVALASVIFAAAFLAFLLWGCTTALETTASLPIALRFLLMNIVGIMLLRVRRTMLHRGTTWVRNLGDRMPGARTALAGAAGGGGGAGAGSGSGAGGMIEWGGHPARPRPGVDGPGITPWIHPATYRSPRLAAPNELSAQLEERFWTSPAARPLVRARRGVTYPVRHPVRTVTAPIRAAIHPIRTLTAPVRAIGNAVVHPLQTVRRPWAPLPGRAAAPARPQTVQARNDDGDGYPNNRHPWIPS
jgi:hypothetical protein